LSLDEAAKLAIEAIKVASDTEVTAKNVKVAVIPSDTMVFRRLSEEEVGKLLR